VRYLNYINVDHGPNFCGVGDVILLAHAIANTKGTEGEMRLRSDNKKDVLSLLGEENIERVVGRSPSPIFGHEVECRGSVPRIDLIRRHFRINAEPRRPQLHITEGERQYAKDWWSGSSGYLGKRILLCMEVEDKSRRWDDGFLKLLKLLGSASFLRKANCGALWGNVAAIIDMADVVVAIDSGYAHVAATLGKKTIVVLGPTRPNAYSHAADCVTCITPPEDDPCTGCVYGNVFRDKKCDRNGCGQIAKISAESVFEEVDKCLK
jgi:hypothetical protein